MPSPDFVKLANMLYGLVPDSDRNAGNPSALASVTIAHPKLAALGKAFNDSLFELESFLRLRTIYTVLWIGEVLEANALNAVQTDACKECSVALSQAARFLRGNLTQVGTRRCLSICRTVLTKPPSLSQARTQARARLPLARSARVARTISATAQSFKHMPQAPA